MPEMTPVFTTALRDMFFISSKPNVSLNPAATKNRCFQFPPDSPLGFTARLCNDPFHLNLVKLRIAIAFETTRNTLLEDPNFQGWAVVLTTGNNCPALKIGV